MNTVFARTQMVLVDEKDHEIGLKEKFACHKNPVPLHRAISIVIYNRDKSQILITKRSAKKPTWPYYWSNSVCSHPYPQETYAKAAKRRLMEELGIKTPLKELFRFVYQAKMNKTWGEHELDAVFVGTYEGALLPNPDEIVGFEWLEIKKLKVELSKNPDKFTPWIKTIFPRLV
ncbi:isopentenyl-diphosphate delta-isomerase [Candidatus Woesebacteria bacterium RIFOXYA1_FULL_43_9]|uniref:Isopentenyl-diphosphate delta-isomerase n=1 Tax=Candidatus Woesebacteria bacterium RIFOXYA1_FULL_43_9 TaxID=1802534 RepID=A0A1F8CMH9_9BACT|nr:MAG: isopentenyl-diphosphate delta-isomerase [Candidatus Woesebacteria bacterium RIFOXYA1_FULL_43_9]